MYKFWMCAAGGQRGPLCRWFREKLEVQQPGLRPTWALEDPNVQHFDGMFAGFVKLQDKELAAIPEALQKYTENWWRICIEST